jgi:hypothetical protein
MQQQASFVASQRPLFYENNWCTSRIFRPLLLDFSPTIDSMHWRSEPFLKVERDQQNTILGSPEAKITHSATVKGASVTCQSNTTASTSHAAMNIQFSRRSFHHIF